MTDERGRVSPSNVPLSESRESESSSLGVSRERIETLLEKWRSRAREALNNSCQEEAYVFDDCADDLSALLRSRGDRPAPADPNWIEFARHIMEDWPEYGIDMDGGELQELAVQCGLLYPVTMEKPCSDVDGACNCADYGSDFPTTCYRRIAALSPSVGEARSSEAESSPPSGKQNSDRGGSGP